MTKPAEGQRRRPVNYAIPELTDVIGAVNRAAMKGDDHEQRLLRVETYLYLAYGLILLLVVLGAYLAYFVSAQAVPR